MNADEMIAGLQTRMNETVRVVWAQALPAALLELWWQRGEERRVHAVAESLAPATRALFAARDPDGARSFAASMSALKGSEGLPEEVCAIVPLQDQRVARQARRNVRGHDWAALLLDVREGRVPPDLETRLESIYGDDQAAIALWAAAILQRDDAARSQRLLELGLPGISQMAARRVVEPLGRLRAWAELAERLSAEAALALAASARDAGAAAISEFLRPGGFDRASALALIAPGNAGAAHVLSELSPELLESRYAEGLLTWSEREMALFGLAAIAPDRTARLESMERAALACAREAAAAFADALLPARGRSEMHIERQVAVLGRLAGAAGEALPASARWKIMRALTMLVRAGGRREATPIIEDFARRPGGLEFFGDERGMALARAAGHAREAAGLEVSGEPLDFFLAEALAEDGELETLRSAAPAFLAKKGASEEDLRSLIIAFATLSPAVENALPDLRAASLAALPSSA